MREDRKRRKERPRKRPHEEEVDEEGAKRRREAKEGLLMGERENMGGDVSGKLEEEGEDKANGQGGVPPLEGVLEERAERKDKHKHRHKKEKKKKERTEEVDTRTEEEKLWDEVF